MASELLHRSEDFGRELREALKAASGVAAQRVASEPFAFICYARENSSDAEQLVRALEARDLAVRWDQQLEPGTSVDEAIERALETATAIIPIWSEQAIRSPYLRAEANVGLERGNAIPVSVEGFDPQRLPFRFRGLHCCPVTDISRIAAALRARGL